VTLWAVSIRCRCPIQRLFPQALRDDSPFGIKRLVDRLGAARV